MLTDHDQLAMLVGDFNRLDNETETGFFMIPLTLDLYFCTDGIADKDGANEPKAVVSIGHGNLVDTVCRQPYSDAEYEGSMGNTPAERLGLAPFFVHMMGEKITCLTGVEDDVGLRDRTAVGVAAMPGLELFVKFLHVQQSWVSPAWDPSCSSGSPLFFRRRDD